MFFDARAGVSLDRRMMSAKRYLRVGVDSIARRMFRRRRDVGKDSPELDLRDGLNART